MIHRLLCWISQATVHVLRAAQVMLGVVAGRAGNRGRGSVPSRGVGVQNSWADQTAMSGCDERQADAEIMAQRCDGFQAHVASALNGPFIVLFQ